MVALPLPLLLFHQQREHLRQKSALFPRPNCLASSSPKGYAFPGSPGRSILVYCNPTFSKQTSAKIRTLKGDILLRVSHRYGLERWKLRPETVEFAPDDSIRRVGVTANIDPLTGIPLMAVVNKAPQREIQALLVFGWQLCCSVPSPISFVPIGIK
jgi:hypothetical protein